VARRGSGWRGAVRSGAARFGVARRGSEWRGAVRSGAARFGVARRAGRGRGVLPGSWTACSVRVGCGSARVFWTLVRSGLLRTRAYQGRGVRRRYGMLCEIIVQIVGQKAQDVVAVPGMRDRGPSAGLPPERVRAEPAGSGSEKSPRPMMGHGGEVRTTSPQDLPAACRRSSAEQGFGSRCRAPPRARPRFKRAGSQQGTRRPTANERASSPQRTRGLTATNARAHRNDRTRELTARNTRAHRNERPNSPQGTRASPPQGTRAHRKERARAHRKEREPTARNASPPQGTRAHRKERARVHRDERANPPQGTRASPPQRTRGLTVVSPRGCSQRRACDEGLRLCRCHFGQ